MMKPSLTTDLYVRLDIERDASPAEIKSAYRRKAMEWHPDRHPGNEMEAKAEFVAVSEAYETLSAASSRERYDSEGHFEAHSRYGSGGLDAIYKDFLDAYKAVMSLDETKIESKEIREIMSFLKNAMKWGPFSF